MYTQEEQRQNRQTLIKTLRSGNYKQIKDSLRREDCFCCLGVACDLSGLGEWEVIYGVRFSYIINEKEAISSLPSEVMDYYGFANPYGRYGIYKQSLGKLNDNGVSFTEIANVIEKEPEGLLSVLNSQDWDNKKEKV